MARACPDEIDVCFENVGRPVRDAVLPLLNTYARVSVCGLILQYKMHGDASGRVGRFPAVMAETMGSSGCHIPPKLPSFLDFVVANITLGD